MKWIWVIVLAIIGILAAIAAVEYLTVSIGHLPSFMGGHPGTGAHHHHARGHLRKRGYVALVVAVVAFVAAGFLAYRITRQGKGSNDPSADQLLSTPADPAAG
jgi:amino acid transporter